MIIKYCKPASSAAAKKEPYGRTPLTSGILSNSASFQDFAPMVKEDRASNVLDGFFGAEARANAELARKNAIKLARTNALVRKNAESGFYGVLEGESNLTDIGIEEFSFHSDSPLYKTPNKTNIF